ncbi:hypothetical protein, partial [Bathymodiolus japonicus methanotrophic gill symbiont]|uniref:hypothetical protein n=1 Tax=Bathymodiolus japonicus methanotrophic gill symbiont TaxID=113269 RepID=UPI001C8D1E8C
TINRKYEKIQGNLTLMGSVAKDKYLCKPGYKPVFIPLMKKASCRRIYYYIIGIIELISQA